VYRNIIKIDIRDIGWRGAYRNNIKIDMRDIAWGGVYRNNIKIDMRDIGWGSVYRNNIKIDMRDIGCGDVYRNQLAQACCCEHGDELRGSVKEKGLSSAFDRTALWHAKEKIEFLKQ
jgi:hypothetical protein